MQKPIFILGIIVLAVLAFVGLNSLFTVPQTQQALVLQFGDYKRTVKEPGLHFKIPFVQNAVYLDNRLLSLDSPVQEVISQGKKRLLVDAFARYKITDPLKFYQSLSNPAIAESRLSNLLNSAVRRVLGGASFTDIVRDKRPQLMEAITAQINAESKEFGLVVKDVRIRRADLPETNSEAIYKRMQTERKREATEVRAEGREKAQRIRAKADRDVVVLQAEAQRDAEKIRGEGDGERNAIYARAFGADPEFFTFYRSMIAYQKGLGSKDTTMVLSPNSDFFRYFGNADGFKGKSAKPAGPAE
ncbi:MAG: protease modulator HflC [Hyphomicrobiales bacterium]|nr:MAG: protease modulator HflC [Hyphomicrobiales bacterium]